MNIARLRPDTKARHRSRPRPVSRPALVLSVVDTRSGTLHQVPLESVALHRHSGRYPALCGIEVPAASLTTPAADHCRDCATRTQPAGAASHRKSPHPLFRWLRSLRPKHRNATR
ncbi:MAG: hypothetical protein ACRDTC_12020 [Pseudonocardiaceae bacterium]